MTITELIEELNDSLEMGVNPTAQVTLVHRKGGNTKDYAIKRFLTGVDDSVFLEIERDRSGE